MILVFGSNQMVCIATITFLGYCAYKKQGASAKAGSAQLFKIKIREQGSVDGRCVKFVEMGAQNTAPGIKFHSPF